MFFVVLELVEGQELGEYIAAIHNLSDRSDTSWRCLDLIRQLLLAIRAYAKPYNNRYYVHRDLKPSNMMVKIEWENDMPFQQLKIIDFDMLVAQNHIREDNVYLGGTPGVMCIRRLIDLKIFRKIQNVSSVINGIFMQQA